MGSECGGNEQLSRIRPTKRGTGHRNASLTHPDAYYWGSHRITGIVGVCEVPTACNIERKVWVLTGGELSVAAALLKWWISRLPNRSWDELTFAIPWPVVNLDQAALTRCPIKPERHSIQIKKCLITWIKIPTSAVGNWTIKSPQQSAIQTPQAHSLGLEVFFCNP